jgi:hypothetical protein
MIVRFALDVWEERKSKLVIPNRFSGEESAGFSWVMGKADSSDLKVLGMTVVFEV